MSSPKQWFSLEVTVDRAIEEDISSLLWEQGTTGIVTIRELPDTLILAAYFDNPVELETVTQQLSQGLVDFGHQAAQLQKIELANVPNEDWLKKWKEGYQPFEVGRRFLVTPSWLREQVENTDKIIIEIDPGMAFGTGTHETTRLCLAALEHYWPGGSMLDVGTGTGILAIGAIKLHPDAQVVGCDIDPEAIMVAGENLAINKVDHLVKLAVGSAADYRDQAFNLVLANLTADVIIPLLPDLVACRSSQGTLILSGILDTQQQEVIATLTKLDENVWQVAQYGEWVAIISQHAQS